MTRITLPTDGGHPYLGTFKKKVYSTWGNTIPGFGMNPHQTPFVVFENNKLGCRPCSKLGYPWCPLSPFKCVNNMAFDFYIP
jgi:hypothetical protein